MAMASEAEDIISVCGTAPVAAYLFYHTEDKGKAGEKTSGNGKAQIKNYMFIKLLFSGFTVISTEIICG